MKPENFKIAPYVFNKKDLIIRHLIIAAMSVVFASLNAANRADEFNIIEWSKFFIFNFTYISCIWNANIGLVNLIDKHISWEKYSSRFFIAITSVALLLPVSVHYFFNYLIYPIIHGKSCAINSRENIIFLILSVVITLLVNSIFAAIGFFRFWKNSIQEKEEFRRESLRAEFETLKNQINPHFLFNSLNTLTGLIEEDQNKASHFVQELAKVYRYLLSQKDKETVLLDEELSFLQSYLHLNQIRYGDNLIFNKSDLNTNRNAKVLTLSLQILVENAIKHNIISQAKPLKISITINNNSVTVENNLQKKNTHNIENGMGLNNIIHRYQLLGIDDVSVNSDNQKFSVTLPLID